MKELPSAEEFVDQDVKCYDMDTGSICIGAASPTAKVIRLDRSQHSTQGMLAQVRGCVLAMIKRRDAQHAERVKVLDYLRSKVLAFAIAMETELRSNDHKGGWEGDPWTAIHIHLNEEVGELWDACSKGKGPNAVLEEAADVGNMAMMEADVAGALDVAALFAKAQHSAQHAERGGIDPGRLRELLHNLDALEPSAELSVAVFVAEIRKLADHDAAQAERGEESVSAKPTEDECSVAAADALRSFDAQVWARAFVLHARKNPGIATDEGTMLTWFANAIMRGYDEPHPTPPATPPQAPGATRRPTPEEVAREEFERWSEATEREDQRGVEGLLADVIRRERSWGAEPSIPTSRLRRLVQFHTVETFSLKSDLINLIEEFESKETTMDRNQNCAVSGEPVDVAPELDPVDPSAPLPSAHYIAVSCCPDSSFGTEEIRGRIEKAIDLERDHASARVHEARRDRAAVDVGEMVKQLCDAYAARGTVHDFSFVAARIINSHLGAGGEA